MIEYFNWFYTLPPAVLALIALWELAWKGVALWFSARNEQPIWFVAILLLNTVGILPIVYLLFFRRDKRMIKLG